MKFQIKNYKLKIIKGFTLIELLISISLLGIILAATVSIFVTALKNYQVNFQKSTMQKEINFTLDSIGNDIKSGAVIEGSYEDFVSSGNTIIIGIPAVDDDNNFIYTGDAIELDYFVYYQAGQTIKKHIYANSLGKRTGQDGSDYVILDNLNTLSFEYTPGLASANQIKTTIETVKNISNTNVKMTESKITNLRNTNE